MQAMGWIVLFTPHHQLAQAPVHGDWNDRVAKVLQIWEAVSPCEWFNNQALGWLARLAKHDRQGESEQLFCPAALHLQRKRLTIAKWQSTASCLVCTCA